VHTLQHGGRAGVSRKLVPILGFGSACTESTPKSRLYVQSLQGPPTQRECKDLGPVCVVSAYALETFCAWGPF
jgi:hypothetical protein